MASDALTAAIKELLASIDRDEHRSGGLLSRETIRLAYVLALAAWLEPPVAQMAIAPDVARNGEHPPP